MRNVHSHTILVDHPVEFQYAECKTVGKRGPFSKTVLVCLLYLERENYDAGD